jgi:hypothetical protein
MSFVKEMVGVQFRSVRIESNRTVVIRLRLVRLRSLMHTLYYYLFSEIVLSVGEMYSLVNRERNAPVVIQYIIEVVYTNG